MKFENYKLFPTLQESLSRKGIETATPVQQEAIPLLMKGKDVLACAQTGTGKTIAFLVPMINSMLQGQTSLGVKALILVPTRELAIQIGTEIEQLTRKTNLRHAVIIGGDSVDEQLYLTDRGVDILVGTPGRLHHLQSRRLIDLRRVSWLIIDEGDRMLDMGFIGVIRKITRDLPRRRQSALFSATLQPDTMKLSKEVLYRPAKIQLVEEKPDLSLIQQIAYYVDKPNKLNLLNYLLKELGVESALLFVRTKQDASSLAKALEKLGYNATALHGNQEQSERHQAFRSFKSGEVNLLVATDLAARGIDVQDLSFVINFDLPNDPETYLHRIGRTGRAGQSGTAISLCSNAELRFLKPIKKLVGKGNISIVEQHPFSYAPRVKKDQQELQ